MLHHNAFLQGYGHFCGRCLNLRFSAAFHKIGNQKLGWMKGHGLQLEVSIVVVLVVTSSRRIRLHECRGVYFLTHICQTRSVQGMAAISEGRRVQDEHQFRPHPHDVDSRASSVMSSAQ
jgi:hypothetical protein